VEVIFLVAMSSQKISAGVFTAGSNRLIPGDSWTVHALETQSVMLAVKSTLLQRHSRPVGEQADSGTRVTMH